MIQPIEYKLFLYGVFDERQERKVPNEAASKSLNWLTKGDRIELRRGSQILGAKDSSPNKITGLHVTKRADGTEVLYKAYARALEYLIEQATPAWSSLSATFFPTNASGEDIAFADHFSSAGAQMFISSPNSSIYKIMTANPASFTDLYPTPTYRGWIKMTQNRILLWNRKDNNNVNDQVTVYVTYIDNRQYTTVSNESIGTGDGTTRTFTGTLAFKAAGAVRTCFGIFANDAASTETFRDNNNGILIGSAGGSGTINYTSGAISITFNTAPANLQDIRASYQWENSTNQGVADFTFSSPRTAGQGDLIKQYEGGALLNIMNYNNINYCIHKTETWQLDFTGTDTSGTNLVWRKKMGVPNWRAAVETGDGIYYIDNTDKKKPKFKLATYAASVNQVVPISISDQLNLENYNFDLGVVYEWGEYIVFVGATKDSLDSSNNHVNNRMWLYHKVLKSIDPVEFWASALSIYKGALISGDPQFNNVWELFSGWDDDDAVYSNFWESKNFDHDIKGLKKVKKIVIDGYIQPSQKLKVSLAFDNGIPVEIGGSTSGTTHLYAIEGDGPFVDKGQSIDIGAITLGRTERSTGQIAYHFRREIDVIGDLYEEIKVRFEATNVGYVSIGSFKFQDIRYKGLKVVQRYRPKA